MSERSWPRSRLRSTSRSGRATRRTRASGSARCSSSSSCRPSSWDLFLGPLLDRLPRRTLMIAADAIRVVVFAALPFAPSAGAVVALAFVAGLATGFFRPAVYAGVPNLVKAGLLPKANALLQTVENLSWMVGPGPRRQLLARQSRMRSTHVTFVVSIVLIAGIPARLLQSERALTRGYWRDLADGFAVTLRSRSMVAVLVAWGIASLGPWRCERPPRSSSRSTRSSSGSLGYGFLSGAIGRGPRARGRSSARRCSSGGESRVTYGAGLASDERSA